MLTSGTGACTPQARAMCADACTEDAPVVWSEPCTKGKPCTVLPEGKLSTQNTALAAAAHQSTAAQELGQNLALSGTEEICNMTRL